MTYNVNPDSRDFSLLFCDFCFLSTSGSERKQKPLLSRVIMVRPTPLNCNKYVINNHFFPKLYQGQPFALQLQWADGKAFTSWSGEVIRSTKHDPLTSTSSVIQLGKKFADSLGLVEDQQVTEHPNAF